MHFLERSIGGRRYRIAAQAIWDPKKQQSFSRQVVLGPACRPPKVDLRVTRSIGRRRLGDVGALIWVAEHLDVVGIIDRACGLDPAGPRAVSVGEMVLAVAVQRACAPGSKRALSEFLYGCVPRVSCLPGEAFTGQVFHRLAGRVSEETLERAQLDLARVAVERFELATDVLAFDTTNFDTHIATTTPGTLAQRTHAKSKRSDLRVVGLGALVSETGHVPLLHRTYPANESDQRLLERCLESLGRLHDALDQAEGRKRPAQRTLVRDGGSWGEKLELGLEFEAGYYTLISLPLGHSASEAALEEAAKYGAMEPLRGALRAVRAARMRRPVGALDRTLVVVESAELLRGQKRGIAAALRKAKQKLGRLTRRLAKRPLTREALEGRIKKILGREHLSSFVLVDYGGTDTAATFRWQVDAAKRQHLERTRLGRRVLCTDRHDWTTERIVRAFRGQWHIEELFRRAKKGGIVPWGPSHLWADASLRLHTFATVLGLMLVSLVRLTLGTQRSTRAMMASLARIKVTLVCSHTGRRGRRPIATLFPELTAEQAKAAKVFELERWEPDILSTSISRQPRREKTGTTEMN